MDKNNQILIFFRSCVLIPPGTRRQQPAQVHPGSEPSIHPMPVQGDRHAAVLLLWKLAARVTSGTDGIGTPWKCLAMVCPRDPRSRDDFVPSPADAVKIADATVLARTDRLSPSPSQAGRGQDGPCHPPWPASAFHRRKDRRPCTPCQRARPTGTGRWRLADNEPPSSMCTHGGPNQPPSPGLSIINPARKARGNEGVCAVEMDAGPESEAT